MRRILVAGLLGGVALIAWVFVVDGVIGVKRGVEMNQLPTEHVVYQTLREHVTEPGGYVCNPALTADHTFPGDEPVFSIQYSGIGHASAGRELVVGLVAFLLAPICATWLLSRTSETTLASYPRKVLFFVVLGVAMALSGELTKFGVGGYPARDVITLTLRAVAAWTVVGLVVAWRLRPATVPRP